MSIHNIGFFFLQKKKKMSRTATLIWSYVQIHRLVQFSFQIFKATRQLRQIEAAPDKSRSVLLDYWVGLKWCLVIIHN